MVVKEVANKTSDMTTSVISFKGTIGGEFPIRLDGESESDGYTTVLRVEGPSEVSGIFLVGRIANNADVANNPLTPSLLSLQHNNTIVVPDNNGTIAVESKYPLLLNASTGYLELNESDITALGEVSSGTLVSGFGPVDLGSQGLIKTEFLQATRVLGRDAFSFEGKETNRVVTTLRISEPTMSRTIMLPDSDGTLAVKVSFGIFQPIQPPPAPKDFLFG